MQSLSRIGSGLGVPLYADNCTTTVDRISYARVLVEMDITKDFPKEIKVEDPTGRIFGQPIEEEDKMIGAQVHEAEIKDFSTFSEDIGMNILKHNDREYTWSSGHTYSRIDWALMNAKWMLYIPIVKVMVMDLGCSDHSPLSLLLAQEEDKRPNPFRFLNHLVKHEKFHKVVVTAWGRSNIKVRDALQGIRDDKAPGCDGFNALFFKQSWHIVGEEITDAVLEFFNSGRMYKAINYTTVTLVPKTARPYRITEYTPISCYTLLYKIIAKILTNRLQGVMNDLVDQSQSAFVPGRLINDNIILRNELVKGYGRKQISPRCMLKIDMKKAYDSVEWGYLRQVLELLQFPQKFVEWIYQCISTVLYSILLNGCPSVPFPTKKRLRQGDPLSPYLFVLIMEYLSRLLKKLRGIPNFNYHPKCERLQIIQLSFADDLLLFSRGDALSVRLLYGVFMEFSQISGLVANNEKSSIYFGGVPKKVQTEVLQSLKFVQGSLPFRYLGVPLSTKKVSILQYQPLIDKIMGKIVSWTSRLLSYAGRAQLIKSILFSIQLFWSQIFIMPKKVVKCIEALCRNFLWSGGVDISKKALVAWEQLCRPYAVGGLNFLDIQTWNRAAISKLLWNLCKKKDRLWVKWVHLYYVSGKQGTPWGFKLFRHHGLWGK
ncbi:hypothetical protein FXO38_19607 [Capsicum annuum]|nr:hypothetical protein FXO38_19607 [Capsicum annuum]